MVSSLTSDFVCLATISIERLDREFEPFKGDIPDNHISLLDSTIWRAEQILLDSAGKTIDFSCVQEFLDAARLVIELLESASSSGVNKSALILPLREYLLKYCDDVSGEFAHADDDQ